MYCYNQNTTSGQISIKIYMLYVVISVSLFVGLFVCMFNHNSGTPWTDLPLCYLSFRIYLFWHPPPLQPFSKIICFISGRNVWIRWIWVNKLFLVYFIFLFHFSQGGKEFKKYLLWWFFLIHSGVSKYVLEICKHHGKINKTVMIER